MWEKLRDRRPARKVNFERKDFFLISASRLERTDKLLLLGDDAAFYIAV
jgi:hypothetical protein